MNRRVPVIKLGNANGIVAEGRPGIFAGGSGPNTNAILAIAGGANTRGVEGQGNGWGLIGFGGVSGRGVEGQGNSIAGAFFAGAGGTAVFARAQGTGRGVEGQSANPNEWAGIFFGQGTGNNNALAAVGRFTVFTGPKQAAVPLASGQYVGLYAMENPENWFEDIGGARLANGVANIELDPIFAQTVNTKIAYRVFLTPNGRCSLYVVEKNPGSFKVGALDGADDCEFDYRIIAKRNGFENERLEPIPFPQPNTATAAAAQR